MNKTDTIIKKIDAVLELLQRAQKNQIASNLFDFKQAILTAASNTHTYERGVIEERIKIGVWMLIRKPQVPHGEFLSFVKNAEMSVRLSQKAMQLARIFMKEFNLQYPVLSDFNAWQKSPKTSKSINTFIGECDSWKALLRKHHIAV